MLAGIAPPLDLLEVFLHPPRDSIALADESRLDTSRANLSSKVLMHRKFSFKDLGCKQNAFIVESALSTGMPKSLSLPKW